jgi:hypothetical protein
MPGMSKFESCVLSADCLGLVRVLKNAPSTKAVF